jgi:hypothetical protein
MTAANQLTIFELPSFIINGVEFRGSNSFGPVLTGICNAFMDDTEPKVCDSVLNPGGGEQGLYVYLCVSLDSFTALPSSLFLSNTHTHTHTHFART